MKDFKGTPGPWVASTTDRSIGPICKDDDQSYGMILPVAWVEFDGEPAVHQANANLIAAGPDLLEALQEMTAIVKKNSYPQPDKPSSNYARAEWAESIISKALGEE
ncbi:hypothetical protein ROL61_19805 [Cronobacter sakazakii]|uniref:hypothetical protein n=1 Tax=Cronobacter sakazakii TaxID=28141 RepID=UPI0028940898|nr:hypothetical protein [Cronobacter sakazakii]ELY4201850.1 hypothetical protein [Cronobacter sakazakii]MDT3632747.1 hypothetical protein [Cronobacter sakazakii]